MAPAVRVNGIAPGVVAWPWFTHLIGEERAKEIFESTKVATPLGPTLDPEDISPVVLSLLAADGVTGETVVVDGSSTRGVPPVGPVHHGSVGARAR